jgi:GTP cyclohydrolase IA
VSDPVHDPVEHALVRAMLHHIGEQPRPGLEETPQRVVKAWGEWFAGYSQNPADVLKTFEDGAPKKLDQMVAVLDIPVYSHCEHHMAPFFGVAHIGYVPNGRIVGLSKMKRLVDVFAKRLQVQERLTEQVAEALFTHLDAKGVGVMLRCRHMCMESRGVAIPGSYTVTSALRGVFYDKPEARAEFLALCRKGG